MDSVTQAVLGAGIAGAIAPPGQRRKALLLGAALGTLPDLDVFIDFGDPVANMTYHRGFSHSLFVLPIVTVAIWLTLWRWWPPVKENQARWFWVIFLALITHPLLDAHTAYGTQLLWPMTTPPVMWSTIFIIDPAYTLPLLIAVIWVARSPDQSSVSKPLLVALALSTLYLGWTWIAKISVEQTARHSLAFGEHADAPLFSTPTPLNSLLWRVVVLTDEGYLEGLYSLVADETEIRFDAYPSDHETLQATSDIVAVQRLRWFAHDFLRTTVDDNKLVLTDLRMGHGGNFVFTHAVAEYGNPHWKPIFPVLVTRALDAIDLTGTWTRIFEAPLDLDALQTNFPELGLVRGPDAWYLSRRDGEWGTQSQSAILRIEATRMTVSSPGWAIGDRDESDFYYSSDRKMACFVSNRASGQFAPNDDIWCMNWLGNRWDEPVPMPPPINSEAVEFSPVIRPNGDIYFASDREGGAGYGDIYRAWPTNNGWRVERLGPEINSRGGEWNLEISRDGRMMIFEASHRDTNRTVSGDLYISWWTGSGWTDAKPVDALNTDGSDLMARFIDDQTIVYATSVGPDVELRKTTRAELQRGHPPP